MRLKTLIAVAATLAVVGLIIWQVAGAVHRTFALPAGVAQIAKSTPTYQHGLTLLGIQNVSPDGYYSYADLVTPIRNSGSHSIEADTGLWVKMPSNFRLPSYCDNFAFTDCGKILAATARLSNGLTIPLRWRTTNNPSAGDNVILLVSIPAGYPDTVRWADVTVDDHRGGQATWRILHLPPMQHVLGPGTVAQTTFQSGAIHATARAYAGRDPNGNIHGQTLLCDVTGTVNPSPHLWDLGPLTLMREWEAPSYTASSGNTTYGTTRSGSVTHFEATRDAIYSQQTQPSTLYLSGTRWVRLTAKLQEYETRDEIVVFHNLSVVKTKTGQRFLVVSVIGNNRPTTATTPDGVTATLIDPRLGQESHSMNSPDVTAVMIKLTSATPGLLPKSPLWKRYKGVISYSCDIPKPLSANGSTGDGVVSTYSFRAAQPLPKVIANFPVIIRQQVNLRTVPMTFVLPVGK